jgi:hypothetical protein
MFSIFKTSAPSPTDLLTSTLYDQDTFYPQFIRDLQQCNTEVVIESPFVTSRRLRSLTPIFQKLKARNVSIAINTKPPHEHEDNFMRSEAWQASVVLQDMGVSVFHTGGHHRKLAILDRRILFEGSLNILSQNDSCEIMRRIESQALAQQMMDFTKLHKIIR